MVYISETLLYVFLCIVTGATLIQLLPEGKSKEITVPRGLVFFSIGMIGILSVVPLLTLTSDYAKSFEMPYWSIFKIVLTDYEIGKGWIYTLILCSAYLALLLFKTDKIEKESVYAAVILNTGIIVALGWASHASMWYGWKGFISHTLHVLSIVVWSGLLLVTSMYSSKIQNWSRILRWQHPISLMSAVVAIIAGFMLMFQIVPEYSNSLMLSYGQALLLKHIFIIPLLWFGLCNGFWLKRKLRNNPSFPVRSWLRAEGLFIIAIFILTGFMNQQSPPHNVAETLLFTEPSPLYAWFHDLYFNESITPKTTVDLAINTHSILFGLLALFMLGLSSLAYRINKAVIHAIIPTVLFVLCAYAAVMTSIQ